MAETPRPTRKKPASPAAPKRPTTTAKSVAKKPAAKPAASPRQPAKRAASRKPKEGGGGQGMPAGAEEGGLSPQELVPVLAAVNRLSVKAVRAETLSSLAFIILNDTAQIIHYDRACLFQINPKGKIELTHASGHSQIAPKSSLAKQMLAVVRGMKDRKKVQEITEENIESGDEQLDDLRAAQGGSSIWWYPLAGRFGLHGGLWVERWQGKKWAPKEVELLSMLADSYGGTWEHFRPRHPFMRYLARYYLRWVIVGLLCLLLFVRVPQRIVAPCEVVPKNPVVITAPLEGIVESVSVEPSQWVEAGTVLFEYDKRVPLQELRIAEKSVDLSRSELNRATIQGLGERESRAELAVLQNRFQQEQIRYELARSNAEQLTVLAPEPGHVVIDNPDDWRGKPVQVGEKVMLLSDPNQTKVRMWIPENDNVQLKVGEPIRVFLNTRPESAILAKLDFISEQSAMSEEQIPSFMAEATWEDGAVEARAGLKGTAVLYGDTVSLFYFLFRKPWATFRRWTGL